MLTQGEDVEVDALRKRGWSYVAIGRLPARGPVDDVLRNVEQLKQ